LISPARQVAFDVLRRVEDGGYASDLLVEFCAALDSRDAGLASAIVFGCLRYRLQLDFLIGRYAPRRPDPEIRIALRMGVFQLRYLERIPSHAAVSESVELVKRAGKRSAAGLVNAVLRKIDKERIDPSKLAWPDRATEFSMPPWLLEKWDRRFGVDTATGIATAFLKPAETHLADTGRIQDVGAQSVVPFLDLQPGETFLDLCAAPGNKTAQAIAAGADTIACDVHWHRLRQLRDLSCRRIVLDGTWPLPFRGTFDKILVDAPCSGTGTLGRNPEIKWRLRPEDLADLHSKQVALLRNALAQLRSGGRLVYSTCSLEDEENCQVIQAFPGPWQIVQHLPGRDPGDGFFIAVLPSAEVILGSGK
jgi:16S rRNA (cytosine967-C5)-methyltransferase